MNMNRRQWGIVTVLVILVLTVVAYEWYRGQPGPDIPANSPLLDSEPESGTPAVTPAEMVSDTTFDIISPSTQPANSIVTSTEPGSQGY